MPVFFGYLRALVRLGRWMDLLDKSSLATMVLTPLLSVLLLMSTGGNQFHFPHFEGAIAFAAVAVALFIGGNVTAVRSDLRATGRRRLRFYNFGAGDYLGLILLASFPPTVVESLCLTVLLDSPTPYPNLFCLVFISIWLLSAGVFLLLITVSAASVATLLAGEPLDCPTSPNHAMEFYLCHALDLPARRKVFTVIVWLVATALGGMSAGLRIPHIVSCFMGDLPTGGMLKYLLAAEWQTSARATRRIYAVNTRTRNRVRLNTTLRILVPYLLCTLIASLLAMRFGWVSTDAMLVFILVANYALVNIWGLTRVLSAAAQRQGCELSDSQVALWLILNLVPLLMLLLAFGIDIREKTHGEKRKRRNYA